MAGGVSVESSAVKGGIRCCKTSIQELETAIRKLVYSYRQAGAGGWSDQKYIALGGIVQECCTAMNRPVGELQDCMAKLEELLRAVEKYEATGL